MRTRRAALLAVLAIAPGANAEVVVSFPDVDRYTDAGSTPVEKRRNADDLARHLRALGDKVLPKGQTLRIDVLDLDLAGREVMSARSGRDVRIAGRADWPSIKLRYTLEENGTVVRKGEDSVSDMSYLDQPPTAHRNESLAREKTMLDRWFSRRFGQPDRAR